MTREEAIKVLNMVEAHGLADEAKRMAIKALEQEIICLDCNERMDQIRKTYDKIMEQEPCEDAISRQAVLEAFNLSEKTRKYGGDHSGYNTMMLYEIQDMIESAPSIKPQQPKTGHWILLDECCNSGYYCSECQKKVVKEGWSDTVKKIKFCPNCGAKMVEPQERSDQE